MITLNRKSQTEELSPTMNTFNRKSLYAALAGLGALSGMGAAEAVNLAPEGLGQALIYPYYTVRNGANGFAYNTLLSVVNTTASANDTPTSGFSTSKTLRSASDKFSIGTPSFSATAITKSSRARSAA